MLYAIRLVGWLSRGCFWAGTVCDIAKRSLLNFNCRTADLVLYCMVYHIFTPKHVVQGCSYRVGDSTSRLNLVHDDEEYFGTLNH